MINLLPNLRILFRHSGFKLEWKVGDLSNLENGSFGTAVIANAANGTFTYTSQHDATASDSFTFRANDGFSDSTLGRVTIDLKTDPLYKYQWHLKMSSKKLCH